MERDHAIRFKGKFLFKKGAFGRLQVGGDNLLNSNPLLLRGEGLLGMFFQVDLGCWKEGPGVQEAFLLAGMAWLAGLTGMAELAL